MDFNEFWDEAMEMINFDYSGNVEDATDRYCEDCGRASRMEDEEISRRPICGNCGDPIDPEFGLTMVDIHYRGKRIEVPFCSCCREKDGVVVLDGGTVWNEYDIRYYLMGGLGLED